MAEPPSSSFKYKPTLLFPLPPQLHPATYDVSLEKRTAKAKLMAIRSRLKCHYLLELNNPQQTNRDRKEKLIQEGKYERPFPMFY
uniref:NADH dehydrogenase [ubiquinone] 1 beta subcomplex subunit 4 n=1 Tax=Podarcis muralis TaxID=64176 RepID=A0A670IMU7_PODMU